VGHDEKRMQRKGWNKRGIVGIEAANVLIAFVVIAAALAYVVINMSF
jgi:flagellin FlaB